ncbi:MAG: hypothetical protein DIZ80_14945 [endosymbiont of Galathealinum brachiosum]|uniref:histidine kinase n=1 Tax=endosymbiont of Galathealinum brachiosum TaxID=2200906 RepID=A0A370D920_9GAMM|nr:MAG: hypothetical protein DIZ80_14945 [endosymbiont of Galathealinum brachiosum]
MISFFNNMPIKYKLIFSVYIVLFVIITISFGFIIKQEINHGNNKLIDEARVFNQLLNQDFVSLVALGEVDKAADITSRLRALNKVQGLIVYDEKKIPVYSYEQEGFKKISKLPEQSPLKHKFIKGSLLLFDSLDYQGSAYGYVFVQLSTKEIKEVINSKLEQAAIILFVLLIASFIFSWLIQQHFSNPILTLVSALRKTAETHDYSHPLSMKRGDEIGDLFKGFNYLQNQIEEEKKALQDQQFAFDQHSIVGITDVRGIITYANDMFVKISGYSKEELIGENHSILRSSVHNDDFFRDMYKTIASGKIWRGNICNKSKNGREYWVATTIVPFMGENGKPLSYMAMRTDITKQNRAEANLARAQKMVHIGSWELDLINEELSWSDEIYRIFEIDPEKYSATYELFLQTIHPDDRDKVNATYKESLKNRRSYEIEHRLLMKDGRIKIVREQGETYYDETGRALRSIGVVHDITHSKHTEEALRRSQKMDAVGQLTGGIAHDFNNIMGIILGNVELLELQDIDDDKINKRLIPIKKSAERAAKLTKQLLSFSRRKSDQLTTANINQQIGDMKSLIVHSVTPEIEVVYQLAGDLWLTNIDTGDFQDAVLNIVINARDAMNRSGHLTIESGNCHLDEKYCRHNPEVKEGDYVQLIFSDNGEGMSYEEQQRIFEPFYTTKAEDSGTGLGLAMVFGFIERSNGYIKVYSEKGIGTTFRIYLPRVYEKTKSDTEIGGDNLKSEVLPRGTETILVVDDEESLLELAKETLQSLGYNVLTSNDGKKALKMLEENSRINLLFSDVVMPGGINGYELAELATENYQQLKILLTSGYTQKAIARNGQARFTSQLLSKPYSRQGLAMRIREVLD